MNPHLIEGDFDEAAFYTAQIRPLIEEACRLANSRNLPYAGLFQHAASGEQVGHMMFSANLGINDGVRAHLSDMVVAVQLLLESPEAPECQAFRWFACRQKRKLLDPLLEQSEGDA